MAHYGITSESQLIDYETIRNGCVQYVEALEGFTTAAQQIIEAGTVMNKDALSVDGASMQPVLYELGETIGNLPTDYAAIANAIYEQAIQIYNEQVAELNEYYRQLAAQQAAQQQQKQNNG